MFFYHIDRDKRLRAGMELTLNDNGLSQHGATYWGPIGSSIENLNNLLIEHIFEQVRLKYFPDRPSRFTSFFGCNSLDELNMWGSRLKIQPDTPVWEIEANNSFKADSGLLLCRAEQVLLPSLTLACACAYWTGASICALPSDFPSRYAARLERVQSLPESLIQLPARVRGRL